MNYGKEWRLFRCCFVFPTSIQTWSNETCEWMKAEARLPQRIIVRLPPPPFTSMPWSCLFPVSLQYASISSTEFTFPRSHLFSLSFKKIIGFCFCVASHMAELRRGGGGQLCSHIPWCRKLQVTFFTLPTGRNSRNLHRPTASAKHWPWSFSVTQEMKNFHSDTHHCNLMGILHTNHWFTLIKWIIKNMTLSIVAFFSINLLLYASFWTFVKLFTDISCHWVDIINHYNHKPLKQHGCWTKW